MSKPLEAHRVREVAVKAKCDPRSVVRYLEGKPTLALVRDRIKAALRVLGYDELAAKGENGGPNAA